MRRRNRWLQITVLDVYHSNVQLGVAIIFLRASLFVHWCRSRKVLEPLVQLAHLVYTRRYIICVYTLACTRTVTPQRETRKLFTVQIIDGPCRCIYEITQRTAACSAHVITPRAFFSLSLSACSLSRQPLSNRPFLTRSEGTPSSPLCCASVAQSRGTFYIVLLHIYKIS